MKKFLSATLLALTAALGSTAQASVIDFEATGQSGNCGNIVTSTVSNGFTFASEHHHICDSTRSDIVSNGTNFLLTEIATTITMTKVGGGSFALNGLDASENSLTYSLASHSLLIEAVLAGGGTTSQTFAFDGLFDGPFGIADFQTFTASAAFANVVSVSFSGLNADGGRQTNFALDNIRVNEASGSVPEPGSLVLVGGALAGLGLARRKAR